MQTFSVMLGAGGGFLLAVLWIDLLFDVQVLRYRNRGTELPEPVLSSIALYYRRVTTTARPMSHLVGAVMATTLIVLVIELAVDIGPRWLALTSLLLCGIPILLAVIRIHPNAVRLAARSDTLLQQSALARSICRDHFLCLIGILGFLAVQISAALQ